MRNPSLRGAKVNICFHDVRDDPVSEFDVSPVYLEDVCAELKRHRLLSSARLYFDDGHESILAIGPGIRAQFPDLELVVATPVSHLGQRGYLSRPGLRALHSLGFRIASHGHTHVRLSGYDNGERLDTRPGGEFGPVPPEHTHPLTANQVLFQLAVSKDELRSFDVNEFVLPYGAFNRQVISINDRHGIFEYLTTVDPALDTGQSIRPRYLVRNGVPPAQVVRAACEGHQ